MAVIGAPMILLHDKAAGKGSLRYPQSVMVQNHPTFSIESFRRPNNLCLLGRRDRQSKASRPIRTAHTATRHSDNGTRQYD
jgi:hypothetical protein